MNTNLHRNIKHWAVQLTIATPVLIFFIPKVALAHGGLAEALLLAGFVVHILATLALTGIGTLIFATHKKIKVFLLSFITTFFLEIPIMFVPLGVPFIGDSGFILAYFISINALSFFVVWRWSKLFEKRSSSK
ncbi:MAG: hypothetical protein JXX14_25090 [Deltaproteobacteria bacterium]|nr:hypothetical protein [Deltaproteobacteria bacterium]